MAGNMANDKKTPYICIDVRTVPNMEMVKDAIIEQEKIKAETEGAAYVKREPTPDEIRDFINDLRSNRAAPLLPRVYQKIVAIGIASSAKDKTKVCAFAGDELKTLKSFWEEFYALIPEKTGGRLPLKSQWPVIITCDDRHSLETILNRSFVLYKTLTFKTIDISGQTPTELSESDEKNQEKLGQFVDSFLPLLKGMKEVFDASDKWGDRRPNYRNRYTPNIFDLEKESLAFTYSRFNSMANEDYVMNNRWSELGMQSALQASENLKNYLFFKEMMCEDQLNKSFVSMDKDSMKKEINDMNGITVAPPKVHPFSLVMTQEQYAEFHKWKHGVEGPIKAGQISRVTKISKAAQPSTATKSKPKAAEPADAKNTAEDIQPLINSAVKRVFSDADPSVIYITKNKNAEAVPCKKIEGKAEEQEEEAAFDTKRKDSFIGFDPER